MKKSYKQKIIKQATKATNKIIIKAWKNQRYANEFIEELKTLKEINKKILIKAQTAIKIYQHRIKDLNKLIKNKENQNND